MFVRILLTLASLVVAAAGALLADCELGLLGGDPLGVCSAMTSYGMGNAALLGGGLVLFGLLSTVAVWVPAARPGNKRRRRKPDVSLRRNLDRLNEIGSDVADPGQADARARLISRLEALETSLAGDGGEATREATEQWMYLLRRANDLHNQGDLATDDFKQINTRLLDLFSAPVGAGG